MSRVIRGGGGPRGVVPREVYDAQEEARRIADEAQAHAEEIVRAAEQEATRIRDEARDAGRREARAELAALLLEAAALRDGALAEAERETAKLAIAVARRIVAEELVVAPERIVAIVGEVLGRARRAAAVTVAVHPEDAATLRALHSQLVERAGRPAKLAIHEDPSITRGGCLVQTDLGELDARIEVQLDALARALGVQG